MNHNLIFHNYADMLGLTGGEREAAYQDFVDYIVFENETMTFDTFNERLEDRRREVIRLELATSHIQIRDRRNQEQGQ